MPEEIQGWELYTMLTLRGESEFRAKLADINRLVDDTKRNMGSIGGSGLGASSASGSFAPLAGGPTPGIPGNFTAGGGPTTAPSSVPVWSGDLPWTSPVPRPATTAGGGAGGGGNFVAGGTASNAATQGGVMGANLIR